jgi:hypothetical protein
MDRRRTSIGHATHIYYEDGKHLGIPSRETEGASDALWMMKNQVEATYHAVHYPGEFTAE